MNRIYADHNATSPLLPELREAVTALMREPFANPSSLHAAGRAARDKLERARGEIAAWLACGAEQVVFTATATEANAIALHGHAAASGKAGVVISAIEHPSVSENVPQARVAPVLANGVLDLDGFAALLTPDIGLAAVMWANNETGAVQPIAEIARLCRARAVRLHVDAVQAAGKLPIALREVGADSFAVSAHKIGAPPGAAALIVTGQTPTPLVAGGGQERGLRGGTEPYHAAIAFGWAAREWAAHGDAFRANMRAARVAFEGAIGGLHGYTIASGSVERVPNTSNVAAAGVRGQAVLTALDLAGVAVSHGSACATGSLDPSPVLLAMGLTPAAARAAVRFSFGPHATRDEARTAAALFGDAVTRLRGQ
jgi:cysteine desulfurase